MRWLCDKSLASSPALPLDGCPMFADFRVHGLNTTFFQCFHHPVFTYLQEKKEEGLPPDFLWSLVALANFMRLSLLKAAHAVMSGAAYRKSGSPILFNPCTRKSANMGHPFRACPERSRRGARLGGKPEKRRTK